MSALADEIKDAVREVLRQVLCEVLRQELPRALAQLQPTRPAPQLCPARLSVAEAAARAHRHPDTLRRAIKAGTLRATRPAGGREWVVDSAELERWVSGPASAPLDMQAEVDKAVARVRE
jgi:excisionase family DNA binding protein